ncbi:pentapeptide repeat-containing protein [Robertmurraya korlensis]|uniref:pentapeptide repeat-containing protein n=1 Tax=Robertmurraya korlensis TaxID=519977 RepID=UPI000825755C|nr:pentapeptide repeat-containing protein [Robertmurraya korlensis]
MLNTQNYHLKRVDISNSEWHEVKAEGLVIDNVSLANTSINNANMSKMEINDVNMGKSKITNANLSDIEIQHANLSHAVINHVHLYGTEFVDVVLPTENDPNVSPENQYKPIRFNNCNLTGTQMKNCNLANMEIDDCDISGLKINGILIEELIRGKIKK